MLVNYKPGYVDISSGHEVDKWVHVSSIVVVEVQASKQISGSSETYQKAWCQVEIRAEKSHVVHRELFKIEAVSPIETLLLRVKDKAQDYATSILYATQLARETSNA